EQREGVGGGAGEAADHVALAEAPHLPGIGFDDGLADRHLAVAADGDHAALADGQDGGAVPEFGLRLLHTQYPRRQGCKGSVAPIQTQARRYGGPFEPSPSPWRAIRTRPAPVANPGNP